MRRKSNWQLIQKNRYYSTKELAAVFGYRRSAITYWVKIGLKPINPGDRRFLFYGEDVIKFLKEQKIKNKVKTKPGECYCTSCREARMLKPKTLKLEFKNIILGKDNVKQVIIRGECKVCGNRVSSFSSTAKIDGFLKHYPGFKRDDVDKVNS